MLKLGAWLIYPLLLLPLHAQDAENALDAENMLVPELLSGEPALSPAVDTITPVPALDFSPGMSGMDSFPPPKSLQIDNFGGGVIEGVRDQNLLYKGPGIKVAGDNGMEAFADSAMVDFKAESVTFTGNVSIYQGNRLQRGEQAVYFYEKKTFDTTGMRASMDPIMLEAGKFRSEYRGEKNVYVGDNAGITTDDIQKPGFWMRAKKTTVFPDDKIVFNNLLVYAGDVPVFWFPYLSQPLDSELGYHFLPGARSSWGPFLLNTYGIMLGGDYNEETGERENQWLLSRWHLDLMAKRGAGLGVDFVDRRVENVEEVSGLSFYYLNDLEPETTTNGIPRGDIDPERYKIELKHRLDLDFPDDAQWRLDSNFTLLSDQYYLEDFDRTEYQSDPAPDNTLGLYRKDDDSLLSLYGRFRLNDFYRTDTRSPEITFDRVRKPLFDSPILHEGNMSFAVIGEKAADLATNTIINPLLQLGPNDPTAQTLLNQLNGYERQLAEQILALPKNDPRREELRTQLLDSNYSRLNIYQEISAPMTFGNFLNITPEAGVGYTRYDAANWQLDSTDRTYLYGGVEASTKISKDFGGNRYPRWGLDGLKHILQPYVNWSVVSTDNITIEDPQVDRLTPTIRPRPLDPVRFNAIDNLASWNIVRVGARNRLLTKRNDTSHEWFYLNTYFDAFAEDPEGMRDYSNLYNEARWQPLPWLAAGLETQFPIVDDGSGFTLYNTYLSYMPTSNFEFTMNYLVLNGNPALDDSNQLYFQSYLRLNDKWGLGSLDVVELADGTVTQQQYTLHRDLGSWVMGMGVSAVDNRLQVEYGLVFSLTLKDFPSVALPFTISPQ